MNFNLFNSLILAGIVQGFILGGVVLFSGRYKGSPVRWLGCLVISFSLNNLQYYLQDSGVISSETLFSTIFVPYQLISGPFLLYYGLGLIYPEKIRSRTLPLIFLPFLIALLCSIFMKMAYAFRWENPNIWIFGRIGLVIIEFASIALDISIVTYLLIGLNRNEKRPATQKSQHPALEWFKKLLRLLLGLSFVWILVTFYSFSGGDNTAWYTIWLAMTILVYWIGHMGVYEFGVWEERRNIRKMTPEPSIEKELPVRQNQNVRLFEETVITKRRFLDPQLSLESISAELNLSKTHLSRLINAELGCGFPDYINQLRVREAKRYLSNPEFASYTLLAIGLEAGFASKTTFQQAFRKYTGMTPSEFKSASHASQFLA